MNRKQIIAELRRSACEDNRPWTQVHQDAYYIAANHRMLDEYHLWPKDDEHSAMFLLFVAAALETE